MLDLRAAALNVQWVTGFAQVLALLSSGHWAARIDGAADHRLHHRARLWEG